MTTGITHEEQQRVLAAAWTAAYMWGDVVARCADRALDSTDLTTVEHMEEAATLTVALRNVLRAAEVARPLATGRDQQRIDAAIQASSRGCLRPRTHATSWSLRRLRRRYWADPGEGPEAGADDHLLPALV